MKRILIFFILGIAFISCSEDDSANNAEQFPDIENISVQTAGVGDDISINGTGFLPDENYVVRFNGTEGIILEINSSSIIVEVPQGATSGDITLSVNGQTNIIGTIRIDPVNNFQLYAFKGEDKINSTVVPSIVTIDALNGKETSIASLPEYISDLAFNRETQQIYGMGWETNKLWKIDIAKGTSSSTNLDNTTNVFYELIMDAQNNLYAFKGEDEINSPLIPTVVKIDPSNGKETSIATLSEYISDLTFNNETNEIYGVGWETNKLWKIDVGTGTSSSVNLDNTSNVFYELVIDAQNNLYALKGHDEIDSPVDATIVRIDPSNGNETTIARLSEYVRDLTFNNGTNQLYGIGEENKLFRINVSTGTFSAVSLNSSSITIYELITN